MHVDAAQHVAVSKHLQVVHDRVVTVGRGLARGFPHRGRMRAGRENREAMLGGNRGNGLAQPAQLLARHGHVVMRRGHHFDLRLQQLVLELRSERRFGGGEESLRALRNHHLGLGIHQEVFLLDADRVGLRRGRLRFGLAHHLDHRSV